mmetsp:Transcript_33139/g.51382  ORF Transcript_33139/g.51382 Transcript_33139/m.51382 type:complete len:266 (-) Transcript_33139:32-829(-)
MQKQRQLVLGAGRSSSLSNNKTNKHKKTKNNKSVSFSETATMRLGLHFTEYTDEEHHSCFYSRDDFADFKEEALWMADMLDATQSFKKKKTRSSSSWIGGQDDDENARYCTRGVECHTKEAATLRRKLKTAATFAVMKEQMKQVFRYNDDDGTVTDQSDVSDDDEDCCDHRAMRYFYDDEKIAAAYRRCVRASTASAYIMGLSDEAVAKEYSHHDTKSRKKSSDDTDVMLSPTGVCRVLNLRGRGLSFRNGRDGGDRIPYFAPAS